jgi:hypothetical protein
LKQSVLIKTFWSLGIYSCMVKPKKKRNTKAVIAPLNDGTNTPVPSERKDVTRSPVEKALYKQAENTLGDPHKL